MGNRDDINVDGIVYSPTKISGNRGYKRYAKTLYKPTRPDAVHEKINSYTNKPLPHFFKYAKDKKNNQICDANLSFVNKLEPIIPNPRMSFKSLGLGEIDYKLLMYDPDMNVDVSIADNGRIIEEETNPVIVEYNKFSKEYYLAIDSTICSINDSKSDAYMRSQLKYRHIANDIRSTLSKFGYNDVEVTDILVKYLYGIRKNSVNKAALWICYGDIILRNLKESFELETKQMQCVDCGKWIKVPFKDSRTDRCPECYKEYRNNYQKELMRQKRKMLADQK